MTENGLKISPQIERRISQSRFAKLIGQASSHPLARGRERVEIYV
jgi:hypothetical protein